MVNRCNASSLPTFQGIENQDPLFFVLELSPNDGALARKHRVKMRRDVHATFETRARGASSNDVGETRVMPDRTNRMRLVYLRGDLGQAHSFFWVLESVLKSSESFRFDLANAFAC